MKKQLTLKKVTLFVLSALLLVLMAISVAFSAGTYAFAADSGAGSSASAETDHLGHDLGEMSTVKPATCVEPGVGSFYCETCNRSFNVVIPADVRFHNLEEKDGVYECTICGAKGANAVLAPVESKNDDQNVYVQAVESDVVTKLDIPAVMEHEGKEKKVHLADNAFANNNVLTTVTIDSAVDIGENAFKGCSELETVKIVQKEEGGEITTYVAADAFDKTKFYEENLNGEGGVQSLSIQIVRDASDDPDKNPEKVVGTYLLKVVPNATGSEGGGAKSRAHRRDAAEVPKLTSFTVPANTLVIASGAFEGFADLTTVTLNPELHTVCADAFKGTDLANVFIDADETHQVTDKSFVSVEGLSGISDIYYKGSYEEGIFTRLLDVIRYYSAEEPSNKDHPYWHLSGGETSLPVIWSPASKLYIDASKCNRFLLHESFHSTGLVIYVGYEDGTSRLVTDTKDYTIDYNNYKPEEKGDYVITVTYKTYVTGTYTVRVANAYRVTIDYNDNDTTTDGEALVYAGDPYTIPAKAPTYEGHKFLGWKFGDETALRQPGEKIDKVQHDTTLQAQWETLYTVSVSGQHINNVVITGEAYDDGKTYNTKYYEKNTVVTISFDVANGYKLSKVEGAELNDDGTAYSVTVGTENVTVSVTTAAVVVTKTFALGGGTGAEFAEPQYNEAKDQVTLSVATNPTKDGFRFDGWTVTVGDVALTAEDGVYTLDLKNTDVTVVFTANWTEMLILSATAELNPDLTLEIEVVADGFDATTIKGVNLTVGTQKIALGEDGVKTEGEQFVLTYDISSVTDAGTYTLDFVLGEKDIFDGTISGSGIRTNDGPTRCYTLQNGTLTVAETHTVTINIADYAAMMGWTSGNQPVMRPDNNITITGEESIHKTGDTAYYSEANGWCIYTHTTGALTFEAQNNATIYSIKVIFRTTNSGTLHEGPQSSEDPHGTTNTPEWKTGETHVVNAKSFQLHVEGYTTSKDRTNNGQVRFSSIEIVYCGGDYLDDAHKAQQVVNDVTLTETELTGNIDLPVIPSIYGVVLTWESDKTDVARVEDNKLIVKRGGNDVTVTLTVTGTINGISESKTIPVTIKAMEKLNPGESRNVYIDFTNKNATVTGLKSNTKYDHFDIDYIITASVTGGNNTGKYYSTNGGDWRVYKSESGKLTISAQPGYEIVTVEITFSNDEKGTLDYGDKQYGKNDSPVTFDNINAESITFSAGSGDHIRIQRIEVRYTVANLDRGAAKLALDEAKRQIDDFAATVKASENTTEAIDLLAGTTVNDRNVSFAWEIIDNGNGVAALTTGESGKQQNLEITFAEQVQTVTLKVTATCNAETAEATYKLEIPKHLVLQGKGTPDNPYTVADALNIAGELSKNEYYPQKVYVKGIVSNIGSKTTANGVTDAEIVDAGSSKSIVVFGLKTDDKVFMDYNDFKVGAEIVLYGYIQNYKGTTYEITKKDSDYVSAYSYTIPEPTAEEKVAAAIDALEELYNTIKTDVAKRENIANGTVTFELPKKSANGVTLTWSVTAEKDGVNTNVASLDPGTDDHYVLTITYQETEGAFELTVTPSFDDKAFSGHVYDWIVVPALGTEPEETISGSFTITVDSVDHFTNTYSQYSWSATESKQDGSKNTIEGTTFAYKNGGIQCNSDSQSGKGYFVSTKATPAPISKITITTTASNKVWQLYTSDSKYDLKADATNPSSGTDHHKQTTSGTNNEASWTIENCADMYFALVNVDQNNNSSVITKIVVEYKSVSADIMIKSALAAVEDEYITYDAGDYSLPKSTINGVEFNWEILSPSDSNYVLTETNALAINTLPKEDVTVTLQLSASYQKKSQTKEVRIIVKAEGSKPHDGLTVATAYTVTEALEHATSAGAHLHVKGYIVEIGIWSSEHSNITGMYIADDPSHNQNSEDAIQVYGLELKEGILLGDLSVGSPITVYGNLENGTHGKQICYVNSEYNVTIDTYTDSRTAEEKQTAAIAAAKAVIGTTIAGSVNEVTLPDSTVTGVTLSYSGNGVNEKKLTVTHDPSNETTVQLTIKAAYEGAAEKSETYSITVAKKEEAPILLASFHPTYSGNNDSGNLGNTTYSNNNYQLVLTESTKVFDGVDNTFKLGANKAKAKMVFTVPSDVSMVKIYAQQIGGTSIVINGTTESLTSTTAWDEFEIDTSTGKSVTIETTDNGKTVRIQKIEYYGKKSEGGGDTGGGSTGGGTTEPGGGAEKLVAQFDLGNSTSDSTVARNSYSETKNNYTLTFTNLSAVYDGKDGTLKVGKSGSGGSFTFSVPTDVIKVKISIAAYNDKGVKITIKSSTSTSTNLESGADSYQWFEVDTSSTKSITVSTDTISTSSSLKEYRARITMIEFYTKSDGDSALEMPSASDLVANVNSEIPSSGSIWLYVFGGSALLVSVISLSALAFVLIRKKHN